MGLTHNNSFAATGECWTAARDFTIGEWFPGTFSYCSIWTKIDVAWIPLWASSGSQAYRYCKDGSDQESWPCTARRIDTAVNTCGTISSQYTSGLYTNQWNDILSASGVSPLFCSLSSPSPSFSISLPNLNWSCWSSGCTLPIRSNQPTACGISPTIWSTFISSSTVGACTIWSWHTDPSIVGNVSVLNVLWWWQTNQPRTWTCGGNYHNQTICTTPSLWLCGSAGSGNSQSFLSLSSTDSSLCGNGTITGFFATPITTSPFYTAQYHWNCMWSETSNIPACAAYQAASAAPGICNVWVNNQSLSYNQIKDATLCTQWIPSVTLLSPVPNSNNKWTWSCMGLWWASSSECNANAVTNGICSTYTASQSTIPSNLCVVWAPSTVSSTTWAYQWTCNGTNGGISSNLCSAPCSGSSCSMVSSTWTVNTWTTNPTTTWSNGQTTPISFNLVCTDPDGCVCYNVTIVNWSRCLANNFTGASDSIITPIDIGVVCTDADGCMCNGLNTIINGGVCQTDGMTWYLPWLSDVSVYQAVTSGAITRKWQIDITINYINRGPNTATGTRLEYYLSPLVSKIRTNVPYIFTQISNSGYIQSSDYQDNVLVFPLGDIPVWENGSVTLSLTLNANLTDEEVVNATSIASRVKDSKPLDNAQKMVLSLDTQTATNLGNYIINPLLTLQQITKQYMTMNDWLNINPIFSDIQKWKDSYMSVMTVVRNGIFEWYQYTHSRKFEWDKCSTRIEVINVLARMMYNAGSTDVYVSRPSGTAYIDSNNFSIQSQNFINWAHERGLIVFLNPKNIRWSLYLEPNKVITEWELKDMLNSIYTRYGLDTTILEDLLNDESSCVTRVDFADTVATILRGNPNIMMGYNDEFLKTIIDKTHKMSIIERRTAIQKVIDKLQLTTPTLLYENWYDSESLLGILEAAMDGREYNPITTSSDSTVSLAESL